MASFPALPLGRRPVRGRLLVVYRVESRALTALLPEGLEPRLERGCALVSACFTRLAPAGLFRARGASSDHLAYRIPVRRREKQGWVEATWIARRETSSWLEARCGTHFLRGDYGRAQFRIEEDAFGLELAVEGDQGRTFYLRGERAPARPNSVFAGPRALEEFLEHEGVIEPHDLFAPEADTLSGCTGLAPEPLAVFEARSAFLEESRLFPPGSVELDSAWRLTAQRTVTRPSRERRRAAGDLPPLPALPQA